VLAEELNSRGIVTIQDTVMHDKNDYSNAYTNSKKSVTEYLKQYPTIKYVIDLHRDAVFTSDGTNQKPVTTINGQQVAQVMLVVGTNQGGANHPTEEEPYRRGCASGGHEQRLSDVFTSNLP
jgi:stage II sporulation protein P